MAEQERKQRLLFDRLFFLVASFALIAAETREAAPGCVKNFCAHHGAAFLCFATANKENQIDGGQRDQKAAGRCTQWEPSG